MENKVLNPICWVEIPVQDMDRAIKFYQEVFGIEIYKMEGEMNGMQMAFFPSSDGAYGSPAALVKMEGCCEAAAAGGVLVYFSSYARDLAVELGRVVAAGGIVEMDKTLINEQIGYMAMFSDTEGNCLGLHSH